MRQHVCEPPLKSFLGYVVVCTPAQQTTQASRVRKAESWAAGGKQLHLDKGRQKTKARKAKAGDDFHFQEVYGSLSHLSIKLSSKT